MIDSMFELSFLLPFSGCVAAVRISRSYNSVVKNKTVRTELYLLFAKATLAVNFHHTKYKFGFVQIQLIQATLPNFYAYGLWRIQH